VRTDAVVVGGGFTGCAAALALAERGASVVLVEASLIGWGASGRAGGQVIPGLKYDPDELEVMFGREAGARMIAATGSVGDEVFGLIGRHAIDCAPVRSGWLQPAVSLQALRTVTQRCEQWARRGADVEALDRHRLAELLGSEHYHGGWLDRRAGTVQPLSFVRGLAAAAQRAGARLYVRSPATALARRNGKWSLETPRGEVQADAVLLGTNGYTDRLWPGLRRTIVPLISIQAATQPLPANLGAAILPQESCASDTRRLTWYYRRDAQGRLIMGGRAPFHDNPGWADAAHLRAAIDTLYPQLKAVPLEYCWGGRVAMTQDHLPRLTELAPGLWAALGYNGRGIGLATLFGRLLAELAQGAASGDMPFPVTPMRPIAGHAFTRMAARTIVRYYRLRDRLESA